MTTTTFPRVFAVVRFGASLDEIDAALTGQCETKRSFRVHQRERQIDWKEVAAGMLRVAAAQRADAADNGSTLMQDTLEEAPICILVGAIPPRSRPIPMASEADTRVSFAMRENTCARVTEVL